MRLGHIKQAIVGTFKDLQNNHTMPLAAGLSYYFVLSLFPLLIFAAAIVAYLPIPDLFDHILGVLARVVPADSMALVRKILADVITPKRGSLLSFGIVMTLYAASGGFSAMIEALNVAYDVPETRPFWKTRFLAIGLTFIIGVLVVVALGVMIVGPQFALWLAGKIGVGPVFVFIWPTLRWIIAVGFTVLAVELVYFLAPNVKQRFTCTLPGAIFSVSAWILLSHGLGIYFRNFANFNKTYGTLGAAIALIVWFYWTALAVLLGAEFNSELLQVRDDKLPLKQPPSLTVTPKPGSESERAA